MRKQQEDENPVYPVISLFYCYTRKDKALRDEIDVHLAGLHRSYPIISWYDARIIPGMNWKQEIEAHLNTADIILLLVSSNFIDSDYCYGREMQLAIDRHNRGEAHVIPILLRPVDWKDTPFSRLQMLPTDAKPVTEWANPDAAFADIARGIRSAVNDIITQKRLREKEQPQDSRQSASPGLFSTSREATETLMESRKVLETQRHYEEEQTHTSEKSNGLPHFAPLKPQRSHVSMRTIFLASLALLVLLASVGGYRYISGIHQTAIDPQSPYPLFGKLALADTLTMNNPVYGWEEYTTNPTGGACQFRGGAYHSSALNVQYLNACLATKSNFNNFAFEARMTIIKGDCGGLFFRSSLRSTDWRKWTFYNFEVCQNGTYLLLRSFTDKLIFNDVSAEIHTGLNQSNVIAVVANDHTLDLYVNNHKISSFARDYSYSEGRIGIEASPLLPVVTDVTMASPTEVVFSNIRVWTS